MDKFILERTSKEIVTLLVSQYNLLNYVKKKCIDKLKERLNEQNFTVETRNLKL